MIDNYRDYRCLSHNFAFYVTGVLVLLVAGKYNLANTYRVFPPNRTRQGHDEDYLRYSRYVSDETGGIDETLFRKCHFAKEGIAFGEIM